MPSHERFIYESKAAAIQQEASQLVLPTTSLFLRIFATSAWPEGASEESRALGAAGAVLARRWKDLQPPVTLAPMWEQLVADFDVLAGLFQDVAALESLSGGRLVGRTRTLQASFTRQLEVMNRTEGRMFLEEERLRIRSG